MKIVWPPEEERTFKYLVETDRTNCIEISYGENEITRNKGGKSADTEKV